MWFTFSFYFILIQAAQVFEWDSDLTTNMVFWLAFATKTLDFFFYFFFYLNKLKIPWWMISQSCLFNLISYCSLKLIVFITVQLQPRKQIIDKTEKQGLIFIYLKKLFSVKAQLSTVLKPKLISTVKY